MMSTETNAPANADTAEVSLAAEAGLADNVGNRNPTTRWEAEIEKVLAAGEKREAAKPKTDAPKPAEPTGLNEGESWDAIYKAQPPDVQRAMAQMRKDYTRKTQELAKQRRDVESQSQALLTSTAYQKIQEQASAQPGEFDPFDTESFTNYIDKKVAERLASVLEPVRQEQVTNQAKAKYESFLEGHSDLKTDSALRNEVAAALKTNASLSLEDAYYAIKGRKAVERERESAERQASERRAARAAALNVQSGSKLAGGAVRTDVKGKSAWEVYQALAKAQS
jgi:hypothetical protein